MNFDRRDLSDDTLLELYEHLLMPRLIEEKMLILLRQGRVSKWFSGIGQEAISVGITAALQPQDYLLPLHRNLGVFTTRGLPLTRLLQQWLGKPGGYTRSRDRSFHFGSPADRIIGMISHLGAMLPVADGLALASNLDGEPYLAAAFSGDGGTSEGEVHEAINVASVWNLPVLFVIEQNGYGLSTPSSEQYRADKLALRAAGYGIPGYTIDGNNLLEVYHVTREIAARMREDRSPVILECVTFRMRGHEEASGTKYVPQALMDAWRERDPVQQYESWLRTTGVLSEEHQQALRQQLKHEISQAVEAALAAPDVVPDLSQELGDVYAPAADTPAAPAAGTRELRFVDAISEGLRQGMEQHPELVLMGQDIAEYGGVFKITEGFVEAFGKERVRNTPICEAAILGAGLGLSLAGKKAMVEMQFADFVSCGFNQIVNNLAKNHYRWGHAADVVVRMPTGGGMGAGPYHSQSNEAWFTHTPGVKVLYPAFPYDAKGLLASALADPNPVLFFEHKGLYRSVTGAVPGVYYQLPIGKAAVAQAGEALSLVTYGMGVHWALEVAAQFDDEEVEVIDLRSLLPWDREAVFASVQKTGRCLVLSEATYTGGFAAEVAAEVAEHCFEWLDAPVARMAALDTPVPFHPALEQQFLPKARLQEKVEALLAY